jgi:hypothetical protein
LFFWTIYIWGIWTKHVPGLRIESFAVINLRGVSTNKKYYNLYIVICLLFLYAHLEEIVTRAKNYCFNVQVCAGL